MGEASKKYRLVLASQSPRRKELLEALHIPFDIWPSGVIEETDIVEPENVVRELARIKGESVFHLLLKNQEYKSTSPFVLSSDTIVVCEGIIYGKPKNNEEARQILRKLSNKQHEVLTAVCFHYISMGGDEEKNHLFFERTYVTFAKISDDVLEYYVGTGDSLDKAGAYGIQGQAQVFIEKISGGHSNVIGLPVHAVLNELKIIFNFDKNNPYLWREHFA